MRKIQNIQILFKFSVCAPLKFPQQPKTLGSPHLILRSWLLCAGKMCINLNCLVRLWLRFCFTGHHNCGQTIAVTHIFQKLVSWVASCNCAKFDVCVDFSYTIAYCLSLNVVVQVWVPKLTSCTQFQLVFSSINWTGKFAFVSSFFHVLWETTMVWFIFWTVNYHMIKSEYQQLKEANFLMVNEVLFR